jgi:hypothetical protein
MRCFICGERVTIVEPHMMIGLDKPYCNLWFHKDHYKSVKDTLYSTLTVKQVLDYLDAQNVKVKRATNGTKS